MFEIKEKPKTGELYFALEQINNALGVNRDKLFWTFMCGSSNSLSIKITDVEKAFETMELAHTLFGDDKKYTYLSGDSGRGDLIFDIHYGGIEFYVSIYGFPYKTLPEVRNVEN